MARREGEDGETSLEYTVSIQPEAEAEILEAHRWYEEQSGGLGAEFSRAVEACLAGVTRHPLACAVVHGDVRRALLRRFPYGIFYLIDADRIIVLGCLHGSRDPATWPRGS